MSTRLSLLFILLLSTGTTSTVDAKQVTGILQGKQQITLKAKSKGEITKINYREGAFVPRQAVVAVIDDRKAVIERKLALIGYQAALSDYKRSLKSKLSASREETARLKNELRRKKALLELKSFDLENTKVISPIGGIMAKRYVDRGETVSTGDKVFDIVVMDELIIELDLMPPEAVKLKKDQILSFQANLHKRVFFKARVSHVSPVIDPASGTIRVRLSLKNPKGKGNSYILRPGDFVVVEYRSGR